MEGKANKLGARGVGRKVLIGKEVAIRPAAGPIAEYFLFARQTLVIVGANL